MIDECQLKFNQYYKILIIIQKLELFWPRKKLFLLTPKQSDLAVFDILHDTNYVVY